MKSSGGEGGRSPRAIKQVKRQANHRAQPTSHRAQSTSHQANKQVNEPSSINQQALYFFPIIERSGRRIVMIFY